MEYSSLEEAFPRYEPKKKSKKSRKVPLVEETMDPDRPFSQKMPYVEAFQDISANLPNIPKMTPVLKDTPSYFGKDMDEEEGFTNIIGNDPSYKLEPHFAGQFLGEGLDKSQGKQTLPAVNVNDAWKPLTHTGVPTASFHYLPKEPKLPTLRNVQEKVFIEPTQSSDFKEMQEKLNYLYRRLQDMENKRSVNAQTEILMFVGTGLGLVLAMHAMFRYR
jgi:hypothetical protein